MRGDLVTIALQGDFGKPRPALVIQSNFFIEHPSITILPITSEIRETPLFRFLITPTKENGLQKVSQVMIDKIQTVSREKLSPSFGSVTESQLIEINRLLFLFLGLA